MGYFMKKLIAYIFIVGTLLLTGCSILKYPPPPTPDVYALPPATAGLLANVSHKFAETHSLDQSGFLLLTPSDVAFRWRLALIDHATRSIDIQYYIWQNDETGKLLFDRLLKAADRGVRVRLLLDDFIIAPNDRTITAITRHPNFDMKIFNPGRIRESTIGGIGEFLLNFRELNRRMHNKLIVSDNQFAIVGGRNIGNPYFGLSKKYNFMDLDVLTIGPDVQEISDAFDKYWNSELSYPGCAMSSKATFEEFQSKRENLEEYLNQKKDFLTSYPLSLLNWEEKLMRLPQQMHTGVGHFIQDEPVTFGKETYRLEDMLRYLSAPSHKELIMVTPYLIPGGLLERMEELTSEGVKIKIVTGSLGANNHTVAHSHYKKYRRPILATGAELYEFKHDPSPAIRDIVDVEPVEAGYICLHVKAMVGDRQRCFIGSLNIDPRALEINTENGLYIESKGLCGQLAEQFDTMMSPENAWRVYVNDDNQLRWESSSGTVSIQPARSFWQRISDFFWRLIPVESQL
jgi:putative cardiolipin synthase